MRHGALDPVLIELANEVPGGAELADAARRRPEVLRVTETQLKFMQKLGLISMRGTMMSLKNSSIRVELDR